MYWQKTQKIFWPHIILSDKTGPPLEQGSQVLVLGWMILRNRKQGWKRLRAGELAATMASLLSKNLPWRLCKLCGGQNLDVEHCPNRDNPTLGLIYNDFGWVLFSIGKLLKSMAGDHKSHFHLEARARMTGVVKHNSTGIFKRKWKKELLEWRERKKPVDVERK